MAHSYLSLTCIESFKAVLSKVIGSEVEGSSCVACTVFSFRRGLFENEILRPRRLGRESKRDFCVKRLRAASAATGSSLIRVGGGGGSEEEGTRTDMGIRTGRGQAKTRSQRSS